MGSTWWMRPPLPLFSRSMTTGVCGLLSRPDGEIHDGEHTRPPIHRWRDPWRQACTISSPPMVRTMVVGAASSPPLTVRSTVAFSPPTTRSMAVFSFCAGGAAAASCQRCCCCVVLWSRASVVRGSGLEATTTPGWWQQRRVARGQQRRPVVGLTDFFYFLEIFVEGLIHHLAQLCLVHKEQHSAKGMNSL